jgi:hypothetical protein
MFSLYSRPYSAATHRALSQQWSFVVHLTHFAQGDAIFCVFPATSPKFLLVNVQISFIGIAYPCLAITYIGQAAWLTQNADQVRCSLACQLL